MDDEMDVRLQALLQEIEDGTSALTFKDFWEVLQVASIPADAPSVEGEPLGRALRGLTSPSVGVSVLNWGTIFETLEERKRRRTSAG